MLHRLRIFFLLFPILGIMACQGRVSPSDPPLTNRPTQTISPQPSLTVTPSLLPTDTPTPFPALGSKGAVVFVADQQLLPVYAQPNQTAEVIAQLEPNRTNIPLSGNFQHDGGRLWAEIQLEQGETGWVDTQYLTAAVDAAQFCSIEQIKGYTERVLEALRLKEADLFAEMVSPLHGLRLRTHWSNAEVFLGMGQEVKELFTSAKTFSFGGDQPSQTTREGTFMEDIYPLLLDVQEGGRESCNTLEQGLAADWINGFIQWPFEYANLNYLTRYRPATAEDALDWRMWAFGIEWIDQQPYLSVMVLYQWDY